MNPRYPIEKILFIDIETAPLVAEYAELDERGREVWDKKWSFQKDTSPYEQYAKAGIYAEFAKVICIGYAFYQNSTLITGCFSHDNEAELLSAFAGLLDRSFSTSSHRLCAHNGKEFDFPFICRRMLVNRVQLPLMLRLQGLKPWNVSHFDTMELWKFGDIKNYSSLNLLAHVFGIPSPKEDMDGSQVAHVYHIEKNLKRITQYCLKDVVTLVRIYNRLTGGDGPQDEEIIFA